MRDPIIYVERGACSIEIAVIENEQVLVLIREALDHVRLSLGEVSDIAFVQDFELVAAVLVDSTNGYLALVDIAPFSDAVPV